MFILSILRLSEFVLCLSWFDVYSVYSWFVLHLSEFVVCLSEFVLCLSEFVLSLSWFVLHLYWFVLHLSEFVVCLSECVMCLSEFVLYLFEFVACCCWSVVISPVFVHLLTPSPSRYSSDAAIVDDFQGDEVRPPHTTVFLPLCDPWTWYLDQSYSSLAKASDTCSQTLKPTILDISHKAKLWTVRLKPESAARTENYWASRQSHELVEKTLSQLAAESEHCTDDVSDVKLRLAKMLGKQRSSGIHSLAVLCTLRPRLLW